MTGNGFSTLSVEIYSRARQGINLEINALSTIMFIFVMILVLIYYVITNHKTHIGKDVHNEKTINWNYGYFVSLSRIRSWCKKLNDNGISSNNKNLIIYNWGDYIDPKLIKNLKNKQDIM